MRLLGLTVALALALCAPAAAVVPVAERYVPMRVPAGPGPAKYDRVFVEKLLPPGRPATSVLVLVPGTNGGAGGVLPVARDIVQRVPRMQVWIVDRREQAFEDTAAFKTGDPQTAQDYYLGFNYKPVRGDDAKFVADWGLKLQLSYLRSVVRRAGDISPTMPTMMVSAPLRRAVSAIDCSDRATKESITSSAVTSTISPRARRRPTRSARSSLNCITCVSVRSDWIEAIRLSPWRMMATDVTSPRPSAPGLDRPALVVRADAKEALRLLETAL